MPKIEAEPSRHRPAPAHRWAACPIACLAVLLATFTGTGSASASPATSAPPPASSTGTALAAPSPDEVVLEATARTLGLRAAFTMTFAHATPTVGSSTPRGAHGLADFTRPAGTITLELPGGPSDREQMVFLPGTIFVRPPSSSRPLQPGRPWIFANFADIAKYKVNFPPYIVQTECVNPALVLSELAWGTVSATPLGTQVFQGASTRHFRAAVNLSRALSHATGPAAAVFTQTITSEITASGGGAFTAAVTLHIDTWVDPSGLLVGARVTPPGAGIGTETLAFDRFGSSVVTSKPPRAKVVDIAAMIPGGEQEALNGGDSDGA
jgi:hypothetical protein